MCNKHYQVYRRSIEFERVYNGRNICIIEGCEKLNWAYGYCSKHNYKIKKYGNPLGGKFRRRFEFHGMNRTSEYSSYAGILNRCYDKNNKNYHRYGGRGIKVCERWLHSFKNFYKDMGDKPFKGAQIDREENDGDYEPNNCRWVDNKTNSRNRSGLKLNMEKARKVRNMRQSGHTYGEIATFFDITKCNVRDVVKNRAWVE